MTTSDKLREFAEKWGWFVKAISLDNHRFELNKDPEKCLSDLTALISEGYVEKAKYDEAVRQRDELKEALAEQKRLYFNLFDEDVSCMYCEVKLKRGSAIILCKGCAESTEV